MSTSGNRIIVHLKSTESRHVYTTTKNKRTMPQKLTFRKYDPLLRRHVRYRESK